MDPTSDVWERLTIDNSIYYSILQNREGLLYSGMRKVRDAQAEDGLPTTGIAKLHRMAKDIQMWLVENLTPYARNPRTHSDAQVAQIAASIAEFGF